MKKTLFFCIVILLLGACKKDKSSIDSPLNICSSPDLADISNADQVVGDGTAASCTEQALRNALQQGGTIRCNCGEKSHTIKISSPFVLSAHTVLDGARVVELDGQQQRIFLKPSGYDFTLQNITLKNGQAPAQSGFDFDECGGAILARGNNTGQAAGGNLTCLNVNFINNNTQSQDENDVAGGAVYVFNVPVATFAGCVFSGNTSNNGGAIGNLGSDLIILNSTFENNQANGSSGMLTGHGGCINVDGVALSGQNKIYEVCGCTFTNNTATKQGGVSNSVVSDGQASKVSFDRCLFEGNIVGDASTGNGGAIFHIEDDHIGAANEDNFSLTNSTFSKNKAGKQGAGLWIIIDGRGTIENCTFTENEVLNSGASLGGAIAFSGNGYGGNFTLNHLTFADNRSEHFAGAVFVGNDNNVNIANSIFSNNTSAFEWEGHQLAGPGDYNGNNNLQYPKQRWNGTDDQIVPGRISTEDPLLILLEDNGGPTPSMALGAGSPAIDAGVSTLQADQRGKPRDNRPDLGAFEIQQ